MSASFPSDENQEGPVIKSGRYKASPKRSRNFPGRSDILAETSDPWFAVL
jgi:hypothetical protein